MTAPAPLKIVVVGGSGVFGSRLAALLKRDGHRLWLAGRNHRALEKAATNLGATLVVADIKTESGTAKIFECKPDLVIDAAGPYSLESANAFRLPRKCIDMKTHYFDLSDNAPFTKAISELDEEARSQGVCVLSGASTLCALTSAVVSDLSRNLSSIEVISEALLPGNRAPRGFAVMSSIISQVGRPFPIWRGGRWTSAVGWGERRSFELLSRTSTGETLNETRPAYLIRVPDTELFPAYFNARSVHFRAGLELSLFSRSVAALRELRRGAFDLADSPWRVSVVRALADLFYFAGSDTGGMVVEVTGAKKNFGVDFEDTGAKKSSDDFEDTGTRKNSATDFKDTGLGNVEGEDQDNSAKNFDVESQDTGSTHHVARKWDVYAKSGDGPYIPGVPARVLCRKLHDLSPGARPSLNDFDIHELEDGMRDLDVQFTRSGRDVKPLFERALADRWKLIPPESRETHLVFDEERLSGSSNITRGSSWFSNLIATAMGFPKAGRGIPVTVVKRSSSKGESWTRTFGEHTFVSHLSLSTRPYHVYERFGPLTFEIELPVKGKEMHMPVKRGWALGYLPLPSIILPISKTREFVRDGKFRFDVGIFAPLTHELVVRYEGSLTGTG